jgi:hypothetical protein
MNKWLTPDLIEKIQKVFEPRYGRAIEVAEAEKMAISLANSVETILKFKYKVNEQSKNSI